MNGEGVFEELVGTLMVCPGMLRAALQSHAPDASGHCRSCRAGGVSSGGVRECTTWLAARAARDRLRHTT